MGDKKSRKRRGFGRIEKLRSGRYRAGYTGPDAQLYRAKDQGKNRVCCAG